MPMSGSVLATAIKATLTSEGFVFDVGAPNTKFVDAFCDALITHIQTLAVVSGPVVVASVSGVLPGGGASGPGAGTLAAGVIS